MKHHWDQSGGAGVCLCSRSTGHVKTKSYLRWDTDWSKQITGCQSKLPGQCSLTQSYQGWNKITTNQGTKLQRTSFKELQFINKCHCSVLTAQLTIYCCRVIFGFWSEKCLVRWSTMYDICGMEFNVIQSGRKTDTDTYQHVELSSVISPHIRGNISVFLWSLLTLFLFWEFIMSKLNHRVRNRLAKQLTA